MYNLNHFENTCPGSSPPLHQKYGNTLMLNLVFFLLLKIHCGILLGRKCSTLIIEVKTVLSKLKSFFLCIKMYDLDQFKNSYPAPPPFLYQKYVNALKSNLLFFYY